jgi:hypothetical protein
MKPQEGGWLPGFSGGEQEMLLSKDETEGENKDRSPYRRRLRS